MIYFDLGPRFVKAKQGDQKCTSTIPCLLRKGLALIQSPNPHLYKALLRCDPSLQKGCERGAYGKVGYLDKTNMNAEVDPC